MTYSKQVIYNIFSNLESMTRDEFNKFLAKTRGYELTTYLYLCENDYILLKNGQILITEKSTNLYNDLKADELLNNNN